MLTLLAATAAGRAENMSVNLGGLTLEIDRLTGGIQSILNRTDPHGMNWILASDGSQYEWQGPGMAWGLGFCKANGKPVEWKQVDTIREEGQAFSFDYHVEPFDLTVTRSRGRSGGLTEAYVFHNPTAATVTLTDLGIFTPFNDNYPDAATCLEQRCHAHIWAGLSSSYVFAQRMGGTPPHLGLVLTEGSLHSYEILRRGPDKGGPNVRGTIALNPESIVLEPGGTCTLSWEIFPCRNRNEFYTKARALGMVVVKAEKYVVEQDEEILVRFTSLKELPDVECYLNDKPIEFTQTRTYVQAAVLPETTGEQIVSMRYGEGMSTYARFYRIEDIDALIQKRVEFIAANQFLRDSHDPRNGAFMVYDNEAGSIYLNKDARKSIYTNEAGARLGMGVLMTLYLQHHSNPNLQKLLEQYHAFVRNKLQNANYVTYAGIDDLSKRGGTYAGAASFYLELYKATRNQEYLVDCYRTLRRFFAEFNHAFYAVDLPITDALDLLSKARLEEEHDLLLEDVSEMADTFVANSTRFRAGDINYGQGIVGASVVYLLEVYQITKEKKYLDEARRQMILLEAFSGQQPDYHLNDIAIRHWDGYLFGKRRIFGDTMPHHRSSITAEAFLRYGDATGSKAYIERAGAILRSNLSLFNEDGSASCAYLYPARINGQAAAFFDPFANDQDWALVHYLKYMEAAPGP